MTAQASVADALIGALAEAGIENVFGLPGGEVVEVLDSIRRFEIDFTLVHHESSAAFMASATARLTGRPSACLATLGPGSTNIVTGVAHAYLDRAPVIVISAETPQQLLPSHTHQVLDLGTLFSPITKASFRLKPDGAHETVREAISVATTGRPGPVHMQVSSDVAATETSAPKASTTLPSSKTAETDNLHKARRLLTDSKRPVLIAGLGLEPEGPYKEILQVAEAVHAPVIVTPKAKGAISDDHPLAAGTIGLTRTDPAYEVLDQADCVVAVGFDVVELVKPWEHPAPLIWLAPWPNQDPRLPAAAEVIGPMGPALRFLAKAESHPDDGWGAKIVDAHRSKYPILPSTRSTSARMAPQAVLRVLREYP